MNVLVPLAEGFEEIEAVTIIDVLRRAGIDVTAAHLGANPVTGSHGIAVIADRHLDDCVTDRFDAIVLPGGMPGSANLKGDSRVVSLIREFHDAGKLTAALCAAPMVLGHAGVAAGRRVTCYPGFEAECRGATITGEPVTVDGLVVTGRGPGCALPFALTLVDILVGGTAARQLRDALQVYWND